MQWVVEDSFDSLLIHGGLELDGSRGSSMLIPSGSGRECLLPLRRILISGQAGMRRRGRRGRPPLTHLPAVVAAAAAVVWAAVVGAVVALVVAAVEGTAVVGAAVLGAAVLLPLL